MERKDENVLVKVLKKSVGLPTGNSSCGCGAPAPKADACCTGEAPQSVKPACGCESEPDKQEQPPEQ